MRQKKQENTVEFAEGDLVATDNNEICIIIGKKDHMIIAKPIIENKDVAMEPGEYYVDELTKDFCPRQKDIFATMYGAPELVDELLAKNDALDRNTLPSINYMTKHLTQCAYMPYYKSYFEFLYNLNPQPQPLNTNLLRSCLKHCPPATQNLELILFLLDHGSVIDTYVYEQIVYLYSKMSRKSCKDFPLINKIISRALEQGMDPFCSLVNLGNAIIVDEQGNDLSDPIKQYTLFKISIKIDNYELYDYLRSVPQVINDSRFEEASRLPDRIKEWAKRV